MVSFLVAARHHGTSNCGDFRAECARGEKTEFTQWAPSGRSPRAASMSALLINKFGGFAAWLSLCC